MIEVQKAEVLRASKFKEDPEAYLADVRRASEDLGETVKLSSEEFHAIRARHPNRKAPTRAELAANFGKALARWAAAGFKVTPEDVYRTRLRTCEACEHWDAKAYQGLGKCRLCGCSKAKLWLSTETCPVSKW